MPVTKMLNQPDGGGDSGKPPGQPPRSPEGTERRQFRPPYSEEEVDFIWYHRIDLGYDWADVERAFQHQFPNSGREGFTGIQCKYYRFCDEKGIPKVRDRSKESSQVELYGMRARSGRTYPWMRRWHLEVRWKCCKCELRSSSLGDAPSIEWNPTSGNTVLRACWKLDHRRFFWFCRWKEWVTLRMLPFVVLCWRVLLTCTLGSLLLFLIVIVFGWKE